MSKKNKAFLAFVTFLCLSMNATYANQSMGGNFMGNNFMGNDFMGNTGMWNMTTGFSSTNSDEDSESNNDEEWTSTNETGWEDVVYEKNATIWVNSTINGSVLAKQNLSLSSNAEVYGDVVVLWNLELWVNAKIQWNVKVLWEIKLSTNAEITWTIYGYKNIDAGTNVNLKWKVKIPWKLKSATNFEWNGKLYAFGGKALWINGVFNSKLEKWILWKLDAHLDINISEEDFNRVKEISTQYDKDIDGILAEIKKIQIALNTLHAKIKVAKENEKESIQADISDMQAKTSSLQENGKNIVEKLITEVQVYIEDETFDKKRVNEIIKNEELARLHIWPNPKQTTQTSEAITNPENTQSIEKKPTPVVAKNDKMKASIKTLLEKRLSKFDDAKKSKLFEVLPWKIEVLIEKTKNEKTKNTLLLVKEIILEMQEELSTGNEVDSIFDSLTGWDE